MNIGGVVGSLDGDSLFLIMFVVAEETGGEALFEVGLGAGEVEEPGLLGAEVTGLFGGGGQIVGGMGELGLDAGKNCALFPGQMVKGDEGLLETVLGSSDRAVRQIEIISDWGVFLDGEVLES